MHLQCFHLRAYWVYVQHRSNVAMVLPFQKLAYVKGHDMFQHGSAFSLRDREVKGHFLDQFQSGLGLQVLESQNRLSSIYTACSWKYQENTNMPIKLRTWAGKATILAVFFLFKSNVYLRERGESTVYCSLLGNTLLELLIQILIKCTSLNLKFVCIECHFLNLNYTTDSNLTHLDLS